MSLWNITEIEQALQLKEQISLREIEINSISIDSRDVKQGSLFFGIKGENYDGSDYAVSALQNGAELCVVSHYTTQDPSLKEKMILVPNVYNAMVDLAKYARKRCSGKVIAITGSCGKTSTKEMLGLVLSDYKTFVNPGNKNNLIGVPFSLCQVPEDSQFVVLEMGMNHSGELKELSQMVNPHIALVINVYPAHLQFFSSLIDIAMAKAEIFEGVTNSGHAVFIGDSEYSFILTDVAKNHHLTITTFGEKKKFGLEENCDIKLLSITNLNNNIGSSVVKIQNHSKTMEYEMPFHSKHLIMNSLALHGVLHVLNLSSTISLSHLSKFTPLNGRGKIHNLKDGTTIIDDSYNANPGSMKAGIANLAHYRQTRLIAIIGDMRELGIEEINLHKDLLDDLIFYNIDKVFTVGEIMQHLFTILPKEMQGISTLTSDEMTKQILNYIQPKDSILIKGSFSMKMNMILEAILTKEVL